MKARALKDVLNVAAVIPTERGLETSRAETLHDLDRNSMGTFGLSGSCMEQTELCSSLRGLMRGISSMGGDDPGKELVLKF